MRIVEKLLKLAEAKHDLPQVKPYFDRTHSQAQGFSQFFFRRLQIAGFVIDGSQQISRFRIIRILLKRVLELNDGGLIISFLLIIPCIRQQRLRILRLIAARHGKACECGKDQQVHQGCLYRGRFARIMHKSPFFRNYGWIQLRVRGGVLFTRLKNPLVRILSFWSLFLSMICWHKLRENWPLVQFILNKSGYIMRTTVCLQCLYLY